jgi:DNA recombination protein RmuC
VIPASPTTLIALLKAINYGWNQEKLARNAQQISELGKELHERLRRLAGHITSVGTNLDRAVEAYNQAVGSLENRVLVSARKFAELGASVAEDIPDLEPIETTARALSFDWDEDARENSNNDRASSPSKNNSQKNDRRTSDGRTNDDQGEDSLSEQGRLDLPDQNQRKVS